MTPRPLPVLSVRGLTVSFPERDGARRTVVSGVSLDLRPGEVTAVVGESGSGKSVTALSAMRLLAAPPARYDAGEIILAAPGRAPINVLTATDRELRSLRGGQIAMIFQEPMTSLNPVMSVGAQITEAIRLHRPVGPRHARDVAQALLKDVGIDRGRGGLSSFPHEFSGGMRQRVMIAIALACEPRVLIADEPTTALDATVQAQILDLIGRLATDRGLAVMLITHDLGLAAERADEVTVMFAGRVVESGPACAVLGSPVHPYSRGLLASSPSLDHRVERLTTVDAVKSTPGWDRLRTPSGERRAWWPGPEGEAGSAAGRLVEVGPGHLACARDDAAG